MIVVLHNLEEAKRELDKYVPLVAELTGKDVTLERMVPLMELLGNPEERLRIIHIAGTSGKTSTAYYMAALLRATGKNVGLTVSPQIDSVTECLQINGQPISDEFFCREMSEFLVIIEGASQPPTYYELLCAFVFWVADRQNLDYLVLETGLGGLQDATNVAARPDKICIITDIGYDHMAILGNTLPEITAQKAGIIYPKNHVFVYHQADEISDVIKQQGERVGATLHEVSPVDTKEIQMPEDLPAFQARNWHLAFAACQYLEKRDSLPHLTRQVLQKTMRTSIPARMEEIAYKGKRLVMDGAHNQQKLTAFVDSFKRRYPNQTAAILIALKDDKEYKQVVPILLKLSETFIITTFDTIQYFRVKSMDATVLAEAFTARGASNVLAIPDQHEALAALLETSEDIAVITGSFYLLQQMRNNELTQ